MDRLCKRIGIEGDRDRRRSRRAAPMRRPILEGLEARDLKTINFADGVVTVLGTDHADHVDVWRNNNGNSYFYDDTVIVTQYNSTGSEQRSFLMYSFLTPGKAAFKVVFYGFGDADEFENNTHLTSEVYGAAGDDVMLGGSNVDYFNGGDREDDLDGRKGNDYIIGGNRDDILQGGEGDDDLFGGGGNDLMDGGFDDDTLHGNSGVDVMYGGLGSDHLYGDEDYDYLYDYNNYADNDPGEDWLDGGPDSAIMYGGDEDHFANGDITYNDDTYNFAPESPSSLLRARRRGAADLK